MVADIGASTGKLTRLILDYGLKVRTIEPNDNMKSYGIKNTKGRNVEWTDGTGEDTQLNSQSVYATFYGSSFNVVEQKLALKEVERI